MPKKEEICGNCNGTGKDPATDTKCSFCDGTGYGTEFKEEVHTAFTETGKGKVERSAVEFVKDYERKQGRDPIVLKQGSGYDIQSGDRQIEVKGRSAGKDAGVFVLMNENNIMALQKNKNWYLYIVYDLKEGKTPKLKILTKAQVLERVKFGVIWEVDLRKADFQTPDA